MSKPSKKTPIVDVVSRAHAWCERHLDRGAQGDEPVRFATPDAELLAAARDDLNLDDEGWDGTHYIRGIRHVQRAHPEYDRPYRARGLGHDHGILEHLVRTSPQYQRTLNTIAQFVQSAPWRVDAGKRATEAFEAGAEVQRITVERSLFKMQGGLRRFLDEAVFSLLTAGFAVWVRIDHPDGTLRKMAFRRSNTVYRWILNPEGTELVGVEFKTSSGEFYVIQAEHLFILTIGQLGIDFEGRCPARVSAPWIKAKQLAAQLWAAGLQKYGTPVIWIESPDKDVSDSERYINIWDHFNAADFPAIAGKKGQKATILSPGGQLADYESFLRYCDEQILLPLSSEGAAIGFTKHGAFNLGEMKDTQQMRVALFIADLIADAVNGVDNTSYTGLVKHTIDCAYGDGEPSAIAGDYPKLVVALEQDVEVETILSAKAQGLVQANEAVIEHMHERLKLPPPIFDEAGQ